MGDLPMMKLAVNEIFGPTIQGEGPFTGYPTMFLRLAACNLACSFCDTPYTWNWKKYDIRKESIPMAIEDVKAQIEATAGDIKHLVISGGEPMLQQKNLFVLTKMLHDDGWFTEIETAGTIAPITTELVRHYNISPKLANSDNPLHKRYVPEALRKLNYVGSRAFKFVVVEPSDFDEIDEMVDALHLRPVYIMPEGIEADVLHDRAQELAQHVIKRNYILTQRLHVQLFGNRRGV